MLLGWNSRGAASLPRVAPTSGGSDRSRPPDVDVIDRNARACPACRGASRRLSIAAWQLQRQVGSRRGLARPARPADAREEVVEAPGATGWYDTDYEGKRDAALRTLAAGADVFLLHVEATDEAGHAGDLDEKVAALEAWDARILAGLVDGLDAPVRLCIALPEGVGDLDSPGTIPIGLLDALVVQVDGPLPQRAPGFAPRRHDAGVGEDRHLDGQRAIEVVPPEHAPQREPQLRVQNGEPAAEEPVERGTRSVGLQAALERDERFQKEIQNGLCPILSEKCLNLKEGETL